jgi:glycosyltransferase involved in cell wall biosynthesis
MYNIGMALKKYTDIKPHLYIGDKMDIHTNPLHNDPNAANQGDWVFYDSKWDPTLYFKKLDRSFIKKLNAENYDVIVVSDVGIWLAPFIKKSKFFFWTTGADITRMPFPGRFGFLHKGIKGKLKSYYMAFLQRWGIKHIDFFMTQPMMPFQKAVERLHIPPQKVLDAYFPIIIDLNIFKYNENFRAGISDENWKKMEKFSFRIFHPSRLMIDKKPALVGAGQWKGNDTLLRGLREMIDRYDVHDICVIVPDRVHSTDKALFEAEIERLKLHDYVVWVKGRTSEGFNKQEMVALYSASDLVVDEFGVGWFGSIVVEGTACSKPTMCYLDEKGIQKMYPWHPIISVNTPETIAEEIAKLYFDRKYAKQKGEDSRRWAETFHSQENAGRLYAKQMMEAISKSDKEEN